MNFVALKMLVGDRAKYLGLIFAVAFSSFLMSHQGSMFWGLMTRTTSQIKDITDAEVWVMDPKTQYIDGINALTDDALYRVRGAAGVEWVVPLFKGLPRAKASDGQFRKVAQVGKLGEVERTQRPLTEVEQELAQVKREWAEVKREGDNRPQTSPAVRSVPSCSSTADDWPTGSARSSSSRSIRCPSS